MTKDLEKKLFDRFSFFHPEESLSQSLMAFGFECGSGWFNLIWSLCEDIDRIIKKENFSIKVVQVKEKFGGLRFYWIFKESNYDILDDDKIDEIFDKIESLINKAEERSYQVCEVCGAKGSLRKNGWLKTLCDNCNKEN